MIDQTGKADYAGCTIAQDPQETLGFVEAMFSGDETLRVRALSDRSTDSGLPSDEQSPPLGQASAVVASGTPSAAHLVYLDGMASADFLEEAVLKPLLAGNAETNAPEIKQAETFADVMDALFSGDGVLLKPGAAEIIGAKGYPVRSVAEPDSETALSGAREGFVEILPQNLSMIRRRLQTPDLKIQFTKAGNRSGTAIALCYLETLHRPELLDHVKKTIDALNLDAVSDSELVAEELRHSPFDLFPTVGKTERPDVAVEKLLDGGVVVLVAGSPACLLVPYVLMESFQTCDDNQMPYLHASYFRLLRIAAFLASVTAAPFYVALVSFHTEMLPKAFMLTVSETSAGIPFPTWLEFLLLMTLFELLRETGMRMPGKIGGAVSIVGALVVGSAAVEAHIVSAPMLIVVAVSAVAGLCTPPLWTPALFMRIVLLLGAATSGLFGVTLGLCGLCLHLFTLRSGQLPYTAYLLPGAQGGKGDTYIRAPLRFLRRRTKNGARDEIKRA